LFSLFCLFSFVFFKKILLMFYVAYLHAKERE
jgi:hypothetical protein